MKAKTTASIVIAALAATLVFVILFFRSVAIEAVYPVERAKVGLFRGARTRVRAWFRAQSAARENVRLKREVASLALAIGDAERLEMENARLRRLLDYTARHPERWIAAEVLSEGGAAAGRGKTIRVGKGALDGIADRAIVAVPEGLVGRVTYVTPHTATVTLITDPSIAVSCEIEMAASRKSCGVIEGARGGLLVLKHLRNATAIPPRSRVLTSGLGGVFPKGMEIGTVQALRQGDAMLAVEGDVLPSVDFDALEDVFIRREK